MVSHLEKNIFLEDIKISITSKIIGTIHKKRKIYKKRNIRNEYWKQKIKNINGIWEETDQLATLQTWS